MQSEKKEDGTILLMERLDGRYFDFFYDMFAGHGEFTEDGTGYDKVKTAFIDKFGKRDRPEDKVRRVLEAVLDPKHPTYLLNKISAD